MSQQRQELKLHLKGLYTSANDFSGCPDGSLDQADDIVIDYENLGEPRRGFGFVTGNLPLVSDRIDQFTRYQGILIYHYGTSLGYYSAGYNAYSGTYAPPSSNVRSRFFQANQNLYISTAKGVYKLDAYTNTPALAGVPKGLDLQLSLTGSSGFMTTNTAAVVTGTTTNGSANLTLLSDVSQIVVGQYVYGTGIPTGTTVSSITPTSTVLIAVGTTTAGSSSMTSVSPTSGIANGQFVTGTGILSGTRVTNISGSTVTLSQSAIATGTGTAVTFSSDPVVTMSANATSGNSAESITFSNGSQVGYRGLWGIKDANNNLLYGAPTQFAYITNNTGTTANVVATSSIPAGITTSHFFQLYRSPQTAGASVTPQDLGQLVYEGNPNSTDLSNGYVQITDSTPDSLRGAALYTGTDQQGIGQENDQPPYCKDFCNFRTFGIYANVTSKQQKKLTILAVGSPNGIQATDTLTIGGITFTADTTETISTGHFQVFSSGTPSQNIANTANSLIRVVNRYGTNTVTYARLLSGPSDLPGQIQFQEQGVGGSAFTFTASAHGTAYSPALPTSGGTVSSAQDIYKNGVMVSKDGQPESVPVQNIFFAGSASEEILRIIPLREYVVILKTDGVWRLTGTSIDTMVVAPFDLTTFIIAPESAVPLSNQVWGFFNQGVCAISDTGVQVKSVPIETDLRSLIGTALSTIKTVAFGVGYETDRKYILALPGASGDSAAQQEYVFNTFTNCWTRWTRHATAGFIDPVLDKLYLANGDSNTVSVERKTNSYQDYVDEAFAVTISSSSGLVVSLNSIQGINIGDVLFYSSTVASVITAIDPVGITVTVSDILTWGTGGAYIYPAINSVIQWKPSVAGNPAFVRQYSEGMAIFKRTRFNEATLAMFTDTSQSYEDTILQGFTIANWGTFVFGSQPWGGINQPRSIRFLVPQDKQVATQLTAQLSIRNGYSRWALNGIAIAYNLISEQTQS